MGCQYSLGLFRQMSKSLELLSHQHILARFGSYWYYWAVFTHGNNILAIRQDCGIDVDRIAYEELVFVIPGTIINRVIILLAEYADRKFKP